MEHYYNDVGNLLEYKNFDSSPLFAKIQPSD